MFTYLIVLVMQLAQRPADLAHGVQLEEPTIGAAAALEQAQAAADAARAPVTAELLLAIAYRESRYDSGAGPMCGVLQADAADRRDWYGRPARCRELLADGLVAQYGAGERALERWVAQCRRLRRARGVGLLRCALNGYAEGVAAAARGWGRRGCQAQRCDRSAAPFARARRIGAAWRDRWRSNRGDV